MKKQSVRKLLKWIVLVLAGLFVVMQVIRPARTNPPVDEARTISAHTQLTPEAAAILSRSCNDCHSNQTRWPWYTNVAPVSWFVINHVNDGRKQMNFSDWAQYDRNEQENYLKKICREVKSGGMPIHSYLWLHGDAKLSSEDVKNLCDWANNESQRLTSEAK
ncbi:MAG: hypothetical protein QOH63_2657 [Acidobacteriota bacterium]|jgi:hypothetical protein|nr:hypothetical protein [Acidobacteriota bacterium]